MCCPFPTKQYLRSAPLPITALLQITLPWILHLKTTHTHKLHEFDFISINLHVCWPLCSHSDGYAWRANRYTLYLPCSTWWMASYDDAIRQHVGFYWRFNGISVQMFIESQMLQQFENIRLCRKFLCLWFWLLLSNISADGKVFLEWSHLLFRRKLQQLPTLWRWA